MLILVVVRVHVDDEYVVELALNRLFLRAWARSLVGVPLVDRYASPRSARRSMFVS